MPLTATDAGIVPPNNFNIGSASTIPTPPMTPGMIVAGSDPTYGNGEFILLLGVGSTVVGSLVKDVFNPVLGILTGGVDFSNVFFALNGQTYANLEDAKKAGAPTVNIGLFINAIIQFLIVSFAVFWLVKVLTRLQVREDAKAAAPGPNKTEVLLAEIRDLLKAKAP